MPYSLCQYIKTSCLNNFKSRLNSSWHGLLYKYSRTSVARTLMARLPWLCQMVLESLEKHPIAVDLEYSVLFFFIYI